MLTYILSKTFINVDVMGFKIGWLTWEQQKLKTVVNRVTRKNVNNESNLPLTISAQDGLIAQDHFFGKKVASQNLQNYLLLKKGDFAYNKSYSNGYPFGSIKRLNKYKEGVISSLISREMCEATPGLVMPSFSASSFCEIIGFCRIRSRICFSRSVGKMSSPR